MSENREGLPSIGAVPWELSDGPKVDKLGTKDTVMIKNVEVIFQSLKLGLNRLAAQQAKQMLRQVRELHGNISIL